MTVEKIDMRIKALRKDDGAVEVSSGFAARCTTS
jgi:hypothetical protein